MQQLRLKQGETEKEEGNETTGPVKGRGKGRGRGRGVGRGRGRGNGKDEPDEDVKTSKKALKKRSNEDKDWAAWGTDNAWSQGWYEDAWDEKAWAWDSTAYWDQQVSMRELKQYDTFQHTPEAPHKGSSTDKKKAAPTEEAAAKSTKRTRKAKEINEDEPNEEEIAPKPKSKKAKQMIDAEGEAGDGDEDVAHDVRDGKRKKAPGSDEGKAAKTKAKAKSDKAPAADIKHRTKKRVKIPGFEMQRYDDSAEVFKSKVLPSTKQGRLNEMMDYMQHIGALNPTQETASQILKDNLKEFEGCRLNIYWSREACGLTCRRHKKDFAYFRPTARLCPVIYKMAAALKGAEMLVA